MSSSNAPSNPNVGAPDLAGSVGDQVGDVPGLSPLGRLRFSWDLLLTTVPIYIGLLAVWIYFDTQTGGKFLGARNLSEMVQEFSYKPVLALGVVLVLLLGEIDLSLGFLTLLSVAMTAEFSQISGWPAGPAILATLVICTLLGLAQGALIAWVRMPSFVVTLGGFLIFEGVAYHILLNTVNLFDPFIGSLGTYNLPNGVGWILATVAVVAFVGNGLLVRAKRTRAGLDNPPVLFFAATAIGMAVLLEGAVTLLNSYRGVPIAGVILGVCTVIFWYISKRIPYGRHIYAVGGNLEAARRAGINTTAIKWTVFGISGLMAGVAGIMLVGYSPVASTTIAGPDLLLDVISIAVIGGVSLTGGRGSVWGVLLGGLVIASVDSGLSLEQVEAEFVYVIKGSILLLAILIDILGKRRGGLLMQR